MDGSGGGDAGAVDNPVDQLPTPFRNGQHIRLGTRPHDHSYGLRLDVMSFDPSRPFTRRAALSASLTDHDLQSPRYQRIFHGIYVRAGVQLTCSVRAAAALLVAPAGSYVSHYTAALLWGGWAPASADTHISSPGPLSRTQRQGIAAHRADPALRPVIRSGLPVAPATVVFLDLAAAGLGLVDLVAVGDSLVAAKTTSQQELLDAAAMVSGPGCRRARRAARWVRAGVDSVMESRLRMMMVLARLPEPQVNVILRADDGTWDARIELAYRGILLAIEYEGRQHAESTKQWNKDIRRRTRLEALGWRFILVTAEGVFDRPEETVNDIRNALRDRGQSTTRCRPSVEWRREFVGGRIAA